MTAASQVGRRPVGEGLFTGALEELDSVRLLGMQCPSCGIVSFGRSALCPNCGGPDHTEIALSPDGELLTYSVLRHPPGGAYRGRDPFEPFAIGLVSLPEQISIVAPLEVPIDDVRIGMPLRLEAYPLYRDDDGTDVIAFRFAAANQGAGR